MSDEEDALGEDQKVKGEDDVHGEHGEGGSEAAEEEQEQASILTVYDPDDFISGAVITTDSTLPVDLFEFEHSYGYNCLKYFNLCACDDSVVCWCSGSIITFMDVNTRQTWFRRSTTGGSIGNIISYRKDPNYRIAVAECGETDIEPIIILYTWPELTMDAVLRDGTTNAYSIMDFTPDGELLGSVGKEPDYNITIWNWKQHKIMLRTSAFTFDVNTIFFSPYCEGQLTTAGAAHIKFWKMAETFTGLKLKGELGRFGKTEICDVLGVYPMPDEKVLSGCEWGNILVWEAGLVKVEVTQRGRKKCHKAPIIQFMLSEAGDEVTTISQDGCVRAWYWDTVDQADPPEDDPYIELNPVAETCVPHCKIMCLKHQKDMNWFAQDGNGGLWSVDLEIDKLQCDHRRLMTCHAGAITGMIILRTSPLLLTAGEDGAIHAYHLESHKLLVRYVFPAPIQCLFYPDTHLDPSSRIILVGFGDGVLRTLLLYPDRVPRNTAEMHEVRINSSLIVKNEDTEFLATINLLKPHAKGIKQITINEQQTLLVTCGEDSTIFIYRIIVTSSPFELQRLGFIETPNNVAFMTWKPEEEYVLLLCCQVGLVMETVLPDVPVRNYADITTFKLDFVSYKETLVKKHFMRHRPFPEEEDLASIDEEALKAKDAAEQERDLREEDDVWIGEVQLMESTSMLGTAITWAHYTEEGIWVIQKETGALLMINPGSNKILKYAPIPGAWTDDITALRFICENEYLLLGTNTGYIRVLRMPTEAEDNPEYHLAIWLEAQKKLMKKLMGRRLAKEEKQPIPRIDFNDYYYLPMHDRYSGAITKFEFTPKGKHLFTCGRDGNIFSYNVNFPRPLVPTPEQSQPTEFPRVKRVQEPSSMEGELMSHEQLKQKEEYDKMMAIANAHKKRVRDQLAELTADYNKVIRANRMLPVSQQIDVTLDPRPLVVQEQELEDMKKLTIRKLAHQLEASDIGLFKMFSRNIIQLDVFPFRVRAIGDPNVLLRPFRQKNLSKAFYDQLQEVYDKMAEAALKGRPELQDLLKAEVSRVEASKRKTMAKKTSWGPPRVASFLLGLPPRHPHPLKKALRNYYQRLNRHHLQFIEWQEHLYRKPDPNALPPGAAEALKEAEESIGNRVLKTDVDYVAPHGHNTQLRLCETRKEVYENKHKYNMEVLKLRDQKVRLIEEVKKIHERLGEIRVEIPPALVKAPPVWPEIDEETEFPEKNLEVTERPIQLPGRISSLGTRRETKDRKSGMIYPQERVRALRVPAFVPITVSKPSVASWELLKAKPNEPGTPIEIEIRERRIHRHLYEQDMLISDYDVSVQEFDTHLAWLQRQRIRVQEKNQLLELFLYQLHHEMNVLNRFESHEDSLAERVYVKLMQVRGVQDQIMDCEHRIEEHETEKEQISYDIEELQRHFKKMIQDHKFADFLRRIFKKKYKPPRAHDDDESESSEESSSSSEEEDAASLDSRDIGPIRLDPSVCPEGCDQETYDITYELRGNRHKLEIDLIEQDRLIELLRKDIDVHEKVKRKLSVQLDKRKNNLKEFMMEKQNRMNEVESVVILRYDQIRASALQGCTGPLGLTETVVFPEQTLLRLRKRVLELQDEIELQRLRHRVNRTHLHRMNIDIKFMEEREKELRAQMRDVLTKKLGRPRKVDKTLDDLLRQMARRHKLHSNMGTIPQMLQQIRDWKTRIDKKEQEYLASLERYSTQLRLAAALQADIFPHKTLKQPSEMPGYALDEYRRDIVRLRIIQAQQKQQLKALQAEIRGHKLKPLEHEPSPPESFYEESEIVSEINLVRIPFCIVKPKDYFPISPLGQVKEEGDVNLARLIHACLDSFRVSRDEAKAFIKDVTAYIPNILAGKVSRYDVIDSLVRKWLLKHGGDPKNYKKQTSSFDALAALLNKLITDHTMVDEKAAEQPEGSAMQSLEEALKDISDVDKPLHQRLGPTLAALFHVVGDLEDLETEETMTSLVNALVTDKTPISAESFDKINLDQVIHNIKDCGIELPDADIERVVKTAMDSLKAQIVDAEEQRSIEDEAEKAIQDAQASEISRGSATQRSEGSISVALRPKRDSKVSSARDSDRRSTRSSKRESKTSKTTQEFIIDEFSGEDDENFGSTTIAGSELIEIQKSRTSSIDFDEGVDVMEIKRPDITAGEEESPRTLPEDVAEDAESRQTKQISFMVPSKEPASDEITDTKSAHDDEVRELVVASEEHGTEEVHEKLGIEKKVEGEEIGEGEEILGVEVKLGAEDIVGAEEHVGAEEKVGSEEKVGAEEERVVVEVGEVEKRAVAKERGEGEDD